MRGVVERAEPERVHERDGPGPHREDVADDPADAGGRALVRLDRGRVVVALDAQRDGEAVADVDDAGALAGPDEHPRALRWGTAADAPSTTCRSSAPTTSPRTSPARARWDRGRAARSMSANSSSVRPSWRCSGASSVTVRIVPADRILQMRSVVQCIKPVTNRAKLTKARRKRVEMPPKKMTAEHKKALAEGGPKGGRSRPTSTHFDQQRPRRGRRRTPDSIKKRLAAIDKELDDGVVAPAAPARAGATRPRDRARRDGHRRPTSPRSKPTS